MRPPIKPELDPFIPVRRYSSAHQRPQDRYPEWREGSLLSFGRLYDTKPTAPFAVETVSTQLGAIGFSHSRMTGQAWARTSYHVRSDGSDPLMVAIRFEGSARGEVAGQAFTSGPGAVMLSDFAQPQAYVADLAHTAVLAIPRQLAERSLPRVRTLHGLALAPAASLLLRSHVQATIAALEHGIERGHAERLGRITLDLLEIGVARSMPTAPVARSAAATGARLTAEMVIERSLASPELTTDKLCAWTGLSRSKLYSLFEGDGGVHAFVRQRRLQRVAEELRQDRGVRIGDLAQRWGFADGAHLSRAFRAHFGASPRDFRAEHGAAERT